MFEINAQFVLKALFWVSVVALLFVTYDIILLLFIAYIIMSALYPAVKRLEQNQIPRWFSVISIFMAIIILFGIIIGVSLPPLISQTQSLVDALPNLIRKLIEIIDVRGYFDQQSLVDSVQQLLQNLSGELSGASLSIVRFGAGVFGSIANVLVVFVFSFYLILEREKVQSLLVKLIPMKDKKKATEFITKVDTKLGDWMRGQLLLMFIIGFVSLIGLWILGIPFAIPLAVIAGFFEVVPIIGPLLSLIPALLVALTISPVKVVAVFVLYILLQQFEGNIIVPRVMKQAVGLDPLAVILALMIGTRLAGVLGALLSVPVAAVLLIVYQEWSRHNQQATADSS